MTNRAHIHEFCKKVNAFIFRAGISNLVFFGGMDVGAKCKISAKLPPKLGLLGKKPQGHEVSTPLQLTRLLLETSFDVTKGSPLYTGNVK